MQTFFIVAVAAAVLASCALPSSAQITTESVYREIFAKINLETAPYDGPHDMDWTEEYGALEASPSVGWDDGHAQAVHASAVSADGQTLAVSGTLRSDMGRVFAGETKVYEVRHLFLVEFSSPEPFEISGVLNHTGKNYRTFIVIQDLIWGFNSYYSFVNPESGAFYALCEGSGQYRLEVEHKFSVHQDGTGGAEAAMEFELVVGPEGTIPVESTSWSHVKALYR